jgi:AcrR family transcriptional regulator
VSAKKRTQSERSLVTKEKILMASSHLIALNGFSQLRVADIAAEAGISVGAVLHHYKTKDAILLATIEYAFSNVTHLSLRRAMKDFDGKDVWAELIDDAKEFFFSDYFFIAVNILLSSMTPSRLRNEIVEITKSARVPVEEAWVKALVSRGYSDKRAAELVAMTFSMIRGFAVRNLWDSSVGVWDEHLAMWKKLVEREMKK